ncbi:hypothetical protein KM043_012224 [Ampulex compressa]|nr:hypothetical protein KM043_012224 [Ampulex compressa]
MGAREREGQGEAATAVEGSGLDPGAARFLRIEITAADSRSCDLNLADPLARWENGREGRQSQGDEEEGEEKVESVVPIARRQCDSSLPLTIRSFAPTLTRSGDQGRVEARDVAEKRRDELVPSPGTRRARLCRAARRRWRREERGRAVECLARPAPEWIGLRQVIRLVSPRGISLSSVKSTGTSAERVARGERKEDRGREGGGGKRSAGIVPSEKKTGWRIDEDFQDGSRVAYRFWKDRWSARLTVLSHGGSLSVETGT